MRVRLVGICNTDLELVRGDMAFHGVLGHEFVGEIMQGPDPAWMGRRVVGDINVACTTCATCRVVAHPLSQPHHPRHSSPGRRAGRHAAAASGQPLRRAR